MFVGLYFHPVDDAPQYCPRVVLQGVAMRSPEVSPGGRADWCRKSLTSNSSTTHFFLQRVVVGEDIAVFRLR